MSTATEFSQRFVPRIFHHFVDKKAIFEFRAFLLLVFGALANKEINEVLQVNRSRMSDCRIFSASVVHTHYRQYSSYNSHIMYYNFGRSVFVAHGTDRQ